MTNSNYVNLRYDVELKEFTKIVFSFEAKVLNGKVFASIRTFNNQFLVTHSSDENGRRFLEYTVTESGTYRFQICGVNETSCAEISDISVKIKTEEFSSEYSEESTAVMAEISEIPSELNLLLFADNHSYEENKYLKYPEIMSHGFIDFQIGLGDFVNYSHIEKNLAKKQLERCIEFAGKTENCFYVYGNHDVGICGVNAGSNSLDVVMTPEENYKIFEKHLESNPNIHFDESNPYGGYYYTDDRNTKIRIIILNTSDIFDFSEAEPSYIRYQQTLKISQTQLTWFANKALDFSDKYNPSEWSVIVFGHSYNPLGNNLLFEILSAVQNGESIDKTVTVYKRLLRDANGNFVNEIDQENGDTYNVNADYSEQGPVTVIGYIHGHDHIDNNSVINGINRIQVRCDNSGIDRYYIAPYGKLEKGNYYFYDKNGNIYTFKCDTIENSAYIGYNLYWTSAKMSPAPISVFDENGIRITSVSCKYSEIIPKEATEIAGFMPERDGSIVGEESCQILCIDKDSGTLIFVPYGTGTKRIIQYTKVKITEPQYSYADLNLDGYVNAKDVYLARLIAAKLIEPTEEQLSLGDVDSDGKITAIDANIIRKYIAKIITALPVN